MLTTLHVGDTLNLGDGSISAQAQQSYATMNASYQAQLAAPASPAAQLSEWDSATQMTGSMFPPQQPTTTPLPALDSSLYVGPGFVTQSFNTAAAGMTDSNNSWFQRGVYGVLAIASAPLAFFDSMGQSILNVPNDASMSGQLLARASLATDTDTKVLNTLGAVSYLANGFDSAAGAAAPLTLEMPAPAASLQSAQDFAAARATYSDASPSAASVEAPASSGNLITPDVYHITTSPNSAASIVDNGIDPAFLNPNSRFGPAFYVSEQPETAMAELAHYDASPSTVIQFSTNSDAANVLDLTNPDVASAWAYEGGPITPATQAIGSQASEQGYNVIRYSSERAPGATNFAILNNYNDILVPVSTRPVLP